MERQRKIWLEPQRFECPGDWRVTQRAVDGLPEFVDDRHLMTVLYGRCEQFHPVDRVDVVLQMIARRLGLIEEEWNWQRPFYQQFFRSFYPDNSSIGWLKITNSRLSFRQRISKSKGRAVHCGKAVEPLYHSKYVGHETLPFHFAAVPSRYLRMKGRKDVSFQDLSLYRVKISRTLSRDGFGFPISCSEDWLQLGSRDPEDQEARENGVNLTIQDYPAADPDGRMTPLVSLCRLTDDRRYVVSRCVSLCPGTGEAVDFRSVIHSAPFYFRSDLSNGALLIQCLTEGQHEGYSHG